MKTLNDLFLNELAAMHDAEHRISKALPKMARAASSPSLQKALRLYWMESEGHIKKLERIFRLFRVKARRKTSEASVGLLTDSHEITSHFKGSPAIDAGLIAAVQKVARYGMAAYGSLQEWASLLGPDEAVGLLRAILEETRATDRTLAELAAKSANRAALGSIEPQASPGQARSYRLREHGTANGFNRIILGTNRLQWQSFRRR